MLFSGEIIFHGRGHIIILDLFLRIVSIEEEAWEGVVKIILFDDFQCTCGPTMPVSFPVRINNSSLL